ncbi:EAL domain-containing protein [Aminobacter aganoensis]|uniref:EAL domain-containing protein (Putative c-di-GMP-specific phosphodiesterase class I) n=1 Tax=Aminobacter aganoensis TaxID=83264 RepID=A0A7X0F8B4_9HYPH|nr:EAL domain-containing protein [Aminobacter sp. DSM 101952]KQU76550.1 diguanylate phosphodiesterase [Aminobacter sp. DSM 101952]MBB6354905.1 EAL domain-containing protein (putative c-di-GMP-specific phosphodiesterase class I) [Aminobacter aganoensis]
MSKSIGLAHIIRHDDGSATGVWGVHALHSAFQPIFAFQSGRLLATAFEGLIRPFRGADAVPPGMFFAVVDGAERLQVETLTRTLHLLNAAAFVPRSASIFINFDPSVFLDRSISEHALRDMRQVLNETGIDPRRIVCEVTEKKPASEEALFDFVRALKANGLRIAVDDFGSAESDIKRIRDIKPDIVKFDAHWISRLMESGAGFALLKEMVANFEEKGIRTVFEGLEESWQLQLAERSGASMVQGFVLAMPEIVPADFSHFEPAAPVAAGKQQGSPAAAGDAGPLAGSAPRPGRSFGKRTS